MFFVFSIVSIPKIGSAVEKPTIQLLFPPDKSLISGDKAELIGLVQNPARDSVTITLKEQEWQVKIDRETGVFRQAISLEKGFNDLTIDESIFRFLVWPKILSEEVRLNKNSEEGNSAAPDIYGKFYPHGPFLFDCESCHEVNQGKYTLTEIGADLCYQCHDQLDLDDKGERFTFVHGPLAFGDCLACHDPHVGKNKYILKSRGNEICLRCHDDKSRNDQGERFNYRHPPVEEESCTICHNPHASPNRAQLTTEGNDICTGCHNEIHFYHRKTAGETLMTKVPSWFPKAPDGTMRCYGCHNPHGSDEEHMFIEESSKFCRLCHKF